VASGSSSYGWFSDWVDQHLALTLTLVRDLSPAELLAAFGASVFDHGECSFEDADDLGDDVLRIGIAGRWTYAIEHFSTRGADPDWLAELSSTRGLTVNACFTETISGVLLARDGVLVCWFDVVGPAYRFGSDQHAFDLEMCEAGFPDDGPPPRRGQPVARFIELTTGVVLTPEMLEGSLPCATLP
jgi:hypothetical protein